MTRMYTYLYENDGFVRFLLFFDVDCGKQILIDLLFQEHHDKDQNTITDLKVATKTGDVKVADKLTRFLPKDDGFMMLIHKGDN